MHWNDVAKHSWTKSGSRLPASKSGAEADRFYRNACRRIYTEIRLVYRVGGKVSHKAVEDAVKLSEEKYCSVAAMLQKTAKINYTIEYTES